MKKKRASRPFNEVDRSLECRLDYGKAKPNRFASSGRAVMLDPDVAEVFRSSEAVNAVLRALIATMPTRHS